MAVSLGVVAAVCLVGCTGTADPSWKSDSPSGATTEPSEPTEATPTQQPPRVAERATQIDVVDGPLDWKEVDRYPAVGAWSTGAGDIRRWKPGDGTVTRLYEKEPGQLKFSTAPVCGGDTVAFDTIDGTESTPGSALDEVVLAATFE